MELVEARPRQNEEVTAVEVTRTRTLAYVETIEKSPNARSVGRVTQYEDDAIHVGPPVLSPADDVLVFSQLTQESEASFYSNIIRMASTGSPARTPITSGRWMDLFPCFTQDGQHIVFSSNRTSENPTLWRVRLSGEGGLMKLTGSTAIDFSPSSHGVQNATVAYASLPPSVAEPQIWTIDAVGGFPTQLREGSYPRISPDGEKVLFLRPHRDSGMNQIWVMGIDGTGETQLSDNQDYDITPGDWSPDGEWIVFASNEAVDSQKRHNFDIWVMKPDGSEKTQLTTNGSHDDSPCWDRRGEFIYFRSNRGGSFNIWRFQPSLPERVLKLSSISEPIGDRRQAAG